MRRYPWLTRGAADRAPPSTPPPFLYPCPELWLSGEPLPPLQTVAIECSGGVCALSLSLARRRYQALNSRQPPSEAEQNPHDHPSSRVASGPQLQQRQIGEAMKVLHIVRRGLARAKEVMGVDIARHPGGVFDAMDTDGSGGQPPTPAIHSHAAWALGGG